MYRILEQQDSVIYQDELEKVQITVDKSQYQGIIQIQEPKALAHPEDYIAALNQPIGSKTLCEMAKERGAKTAAILVSDATRNVPTAKILPYVVEELNRAGIENQDIVAIVGIGVHRYATQEEMDEMLGEVCIGKIRIENHEPFDMEKLVYLGETSQKTPVYVNKTVVESDIVIGIGKIEPHEFAGFSGGRKSILPGVCGEKTIRINHRPEMLLQKTAGPGLVQGNPISDDMIETARMAGLDFIVGFVANSAGEAVGIFCGDMERAHEAAVEFMKSFCQVKLEQDPDIVVTTPGFPLNIDFYQSMKPIIALAGALKPGSVIVLYTDCPDGVASVDMLKPFEGAKNLDDVIDYLMDHYEIQMDHALLISKIYQKGIRVVATSNHVEKSVMELMMMTAADDPQDAVEKAIELSGKENPSILFFPKAQITLPVR